MKTGKLLFTTLAVIATLAFVSCSESMTQMEDTLKSSEIALAQGDSCTYTDTITEAEIESLMQMREEEKMARDVYLYFYEMYDHSVFSNIAKSEDAHTNAVLSLISGYGLTDPAADETGVFNIEIYQTLYDSLTSAGSADLIAALKVGAFIEEFDINDLQILLEEMQNEDIVRVYSNLLQGSESHLRAFSSVLEQNGESYEPQIISAEEYAEILAGENSNGNKNGSANGNGSNSGNQNGNGTQNGKTNSQQGNTNSPGTGICDGTGQNS